MTSSPLPIRGAPPPSAPLCKVALEEHFQHPATQGRDLAGEVAKRLQDYLADNFYITTSGNFSAQALTCALLAVGADRILFSADHPYENMDEAARFIDTCPIAEGDRRKIAHGNAERLFGLNPVQPAIPT